MLSAQARDIGETRPKIVWPDSVKETDFVLPDWYEPGSTPAAETETPAEASTPTPKEPGFETVFAIAGLLVVGYLVLRKKQE